MGSMQEFYEWFYRRELKYMDIINSGWFKDLKQDTALGVERNQNRLYFYFDSREKAEKCMEKCEKRNIHYIGIMENTWDKTFRVDIFMNWKERRPSKIRRKENQILD